MARHAKTKRLIEAIARVLAEHHPMTVRQVYYQLVSRQVTENSRGAYQAVSKALVAARKEELIPWDWIEDRLRRPRHVAMWDGLTDFVTSAMAGYRRDIWPEQSAYTEVWLEKDALSGIFEDELSPYSVTLNVGRGYDGWDLIHNAAQRFASGDQGTILYFGDFDPSGEDMVRSLTERLAHFGCWPEIVKCALIPDDVERYGLPPDFTKRTDTNAVATSQGLSAGESGRRVGVFFTGDDPAADVRIRAPGGGTAGLRLARSLAGQGCGTGHARPSAGFSGSTQRASANARRPNVSRTATGTRIQPAAHPHVPVAVSRRRPRIGRRSKRQVWDRETFSRERFTKFCDWFRLAGSKSGRSAIRLTRSGYIDRRTR